MSLPDKSQRWCSCPPMDCQKRDDGVCHRPPVAPADPEHARLVEDAMRWRQYQLERAASSTGKPTDDAELNALIRGPDANIWLGRLYDAAKGWKERALKAEAQPSAIAPLVISDEEADALALHLCESENEHPEGTQNRFLNDGLHSITFKEIAKRRVRVIVNLLSTMRRSDGGSAK